MKRGKRLKTRVMRTHNPPKNANWFLSSFEWTIKSCMNVYHGYKMRSPPNISLLCDCVFAEEFGCLNLILYIYPFFRAVFWRPCDNTLETRRAFQFFTTTFRLCSRRWRIMTTNHADGWNNLFTLISQWSFYKLSPSHSRRIKKLGIDEFNNYEWMNWPLLRNRENMHALCLSLPLLLLLLFGILLTIEIGWCVVAPANPFSLLFFQPVHFVLGLFVSFWLLKYHFYSSI